MRKEITLADRERGIYRITTDDQRFYSKPGNDKVSGAPTTIYVPSVTWITTYVQSPFLDEWREAVGGEAADAYMKFRGDRGSKVHEACTMVMNGETIDCERSLFRNESKDCAEPLTGSEIECIISFKKWYEAATAGQLWMKDKDAEKKGKKLLPSGYRITNWNTVLWHPEDLFAGTLDIEAERDTDGSLGIIDIKTSKGVYDGHRAQVKGYQKCDPRYKWAGVLRLGADTERGWFFEEVEDRFFQCFDNAYADWKFKNEGLKPFQKDYPLTLSLTNPPPTV
jgi:hypothetical protein